MEQRTKILLKISCLRGLDIHIPLLSTLGMTRRALYLLFEARVFVCETARTLFGT
jgi:hypothetical protein